MLEKSWGKSVVFSLEKPAREEYGDYSTNLALILAKKFKKNPNEVAGELVSKIKKNKASKIFEKIEIAGPGFVNFWLKKEFIIEEFKKLAKLKTLPKFKTPKDKIQIEFISANPTGPLHIGHGRGAFYGEALSRILKLTNYKVEKEYFINNSKESNQIQELGRTALGEGKSYLTQYLKSQISNLKSSIKNLKLKNPPNIYGEAGYLLAEVIQKNNKKFIEKNLGIKFDNWVSEEKDLRKKNYFNKILEVLRRKNLVYQKDGALWLKTSKYGDDEDRVIIRKDGLASYFLSDLAYHFQKIERGYKKIINIWGADHQGHVKRFFAAKKMLGWKPEIEILISQVVTIKKGGEYKKISKRKGEVILLEDLLKEIGNDAARWFYLQKSLNTHMEFNVELAKKREEKNPVFYVQYANARMSSILKKARIKNMGTSQAPTFENLEPAEITLIKKILEFQDALEETINDYQVHRVLNYVYELACAFSVFYRDVKVLGSGEERSRLFLVKQTKKILSSLLYLLGISAPERM